MSKRLIVASGCFLATIGLMFWGIVQPSGINYLWRYFAWVDQTTVVFVLAAVTIYMIRKRLFFWVALIPASFYCFISVCFIIGSDKQGINALLPSSFHDTGWTIAYVIGAIGALCFAMTILWWGFKTKKQPHVWVEEKQINWNKS
jgi:carbon starvation protein CstA